MPGIILTLFLLVTSSCQYHVTDIDGNEYRVIRIDTQLWIAQNLNVSRFRNGDSIMEARTTEEWISAGLAEKPAWCYYQNLEENGMLYGKLYNYYAVSDPRGLTPNGYHIPSDAEWTGLTDYLGGESLAGKKLKADKGWNNDLNGTNKTNFSGFPGGNRSTKANFDFIGMGGFWWTSTESLTGDIWIRYLFYGDGMVHKFYGSKIKGLSVRCIKDKKNN